MSSGSLIRGLIRISINSTIRMLMLPYHEPLLLSLRVMPFVDSSSVCWELMKEALYHDNRMIWNHLSYKLMKYKEMKYCSRRCKCNLLQIGCEAFACASPDGNARPMMGTDTWQSRTGTAPISCILGSILSACDGPISPVHPRRFSRAQSAIE
jgi:hypothetical protein